MKTALKKTQREKQVLTNLTAFCSTAPINSDIYKWTILFSVRQLTITKEKPLDSYIYLLMLSCLYDCINAKNELMDNGSELSLEMMKSLSNS